MSESNSGASGGASSENDITAAVSNQLSGQATGLVETTFAETLGLSMHNAVTSQQSSQMTTAASVTNACARLLQTGVPKPAPAKKEKKPQAKSQPEKKPADKASDSEEPAPKSKKKFNIMNFLKPKDKEKQPEQRTEPTTDATDSDNSGTEAKS